MRVTKGHGTENDFVLLPDHDGSALADLSAADVAWLCDRRAGIGGAVREQHLDVQPYLAVQLFAATDHLSVIARLDRHRRRDGQRHLAHQRSAVIGDAAHHIQSSRCAADAHRAAPESRRANGRQS